MSGSRWHSERRADKQTGTGGGRRPALGPGGVTHWVVATVHVSGLGPALSGGFGGSCSPEFQAPALGGEEWRGQGETDQDGSWGKKGAQIWGRVRSPPATRPGVAGKLRWRAKSGAGLGRAGEGAGKLEQLRKVPKIPGGGGAGGGGPGNDATGRAPEAGGARGLLAGLRAPAASLQAEERPDPEKAPWGWGPPSPSRAGARDWRVFQGRGRLLVRGQALLPSPSPPPSWSNLGIFYSERGHG